MYKERILVEPKRQRLRQGERNMSGEGDGSTELLKFLVKDPWRRYCHTEHSHDLVVLRGYYILKQVMAWFDMAAQLQAQEEEERDSTCSFSPK